MGAMFRYKDVGSINILKRIWATKTRRFPHFPKTWRAARSISRPLVRVAARSLISGGPWDSIQKIEAWRQLPEFKEFFAKAKELRNEITPLTMKPIIHL